MRILATNITSPLGNTTEENYLAVRSGMTGVKHLIAGTRGVPFEMEASIFSEEPDFEELCVASAMAVLDGITDCICIGGKHPIMGQVPELLVVMKPGADFSPQNIMRSLAHTLEAYKIPQVVRKVDTINGTFNGKPDRLSYQIEN